MSIFKILRLAVLFSVGLMLANPAMALRCDRKVMSEGMRTIEIRKYCGEPTESQQRTVVRAGFPRRQGRTTPNDNSQQELLYNDRSYEEVLVEEWTYNFGPRRFMVVVRFVNGLVTDIEDLGYGYHE